MKIKEQVLIVSDILPEEVREYNGKEYKKIVVELTDTDDHDYPSDYALEVATGRYKLLDGLAIGDKVRCTISITGKKGQKGVFHTLRLLELSILEKANGAPVYQHSHKVATGDGYKEEQPAQDARETAQPTNAAGPAPLDNLPF